MLDISHLLSSTQSQHKYEVLGKQQIFDENSPSRKREKAEKYSRNSYSDILNLKFRISEDINDLQILQLKTLGIQNSFIFSL